MSGFRSKSERFSAENGWIKLELLLQQLRTPIQAAHAQIGSDESADWHMVLRDVHMEIPAELYVDPRTGETMVRLPSLSRMLDDQFTDAHLSRIKFSLGLVPRHTAP